MNTIYSDAESNLLLTSLFNTERDATNCTNNSVLFSMINTYINIPFNIVFSAFLYKVQYRWNYKQTEEWIKKAYDDYVTIEAFEESREEELRQAVLGLNFYTNILTTLNIKV